MRRNGEGQEGPPPPVGTMKAPLHSRFAQRAGVYMASQHSKNYITHCPKSPTLPPALLGTFPARVHNRFEQRPRASRPQAVQRMRTTTRNAAAAGLSPGNRLVPPPGGGPSRGLAHIGSLPARVFRKKHHIINIKPPRKVLPAIERKKPLVAISRKRKLILFRRRRCFPLVYQRSRDCLTRASDTRTRRGQRPGRCEVARACVRLGAVRGRRRPVEPSAALAPSLAGSAGDRGPKAILAEMCPPCVPRRGLGRNGWKARRIRLEKCVPQNRPPEGYLILRRIEAGIRGRLEIGTKKNPSIYRGFWGF